MTENGLPEGRATDAMGELQEAVGELNAVLTVLENGNSSAKEQCCAEETGVPAVLLAACGSCTP